MNGGGGERGGDYLPAILRQWSPCHSTPGWMSRFRGCRRSTCHLVIRVQQQLSRHSQTGTGLQMRIRMNYDIALCYVTWDRQHAGSSNPTIR